jgi:hypothetical protein
MLGTHVPGALICRRRWPPRCFGAKSGFPDFALALCALALAGAAGLAWLRDPQPRLPRTAGAVLATFDRDGDGAVNGEEYARVSDGELPFEVLDADGDGRLAPWELEVILTSISPLKPQRNQLPRVR